MSFLRRSLGVALAGLVAAASAGCSKDAEVQKTLTDLDTFTTQLVGKVKSASTPQAGVDEAQKYLDANGGALRAKVAELKNVRGFQINAETKKKLETGFLNSATAVAGLQLEYVQQSVQDQAFKQRLDKLVTDYRNLIL
jgi:hypothetical protein